MDKTKIKNFAVRARQELIDSIRQEMANYGIDQDGVKEELTISTPTIKYYTNEDFPLTGKQIQWRKQIVSRLNRDQQTKWNDRLDDFIEEVAYTWFNRIIAIRFMEVNDYLPSRTRVLSSEEGRLEPDIITHALEIEDDLGGYTDEERQFISNTLVSHNPSDMDQTFKMLFIKQIDALSPLLPKLFEKTDDYLKLLFTPQYNHGVIKELVDDIPQDDFDVSKSGQITIIGWLYQYYITNRKNKDMSLPKSVKYNNRQIYEVTQIFTPDWIVKYMVQNSVGKFWIRHLQNQNGLTEKELLKKFNWQYYVEDGPQNFDVKSKLEILNRQEDIRSIEELRIIDPASGSGHILVYIFDILMDIYTSEGYSNREAAIMIITHNLYGLEIDKRAYQLSYFAVMMKWRQYDRRAFYRDNKLHLYCFEDAKILRNHIESVKSILDSYDYEKVINVIDDMSYSKTIGSLLKGHNIDSFDLRKYSNNDQVQESFEAQYVFEKLGNLINVNKTLTNKYKIVVTNPPYMASSRMNNVLSKYASHNYRLSKRDLFAMFMDRWLPQVASGGYVSMVTMQSWMFLSSFEKFRHNLLNHYTINNLMHMENGVMGIAFGTTVTIFRNDYIPSFDGFYHQIKTSNAVNKVPDRVPINGNRQSFMNKNNFDKIPGSPIAYWAPQALIDDFQKGTPLGKLIEAKEGMGTSDNKRFIRYWFEVNSNNIEFNAHNSKEAGNSGRKWFPYNKGGAYRKWYGNYDYVVNWENNGADIKSFKWPNGKIRSNVRNEDYYFREAITWPLITSGEFSMRYRKFGSIHDVSGKSAFSNNTKLLKYILGFGNTKIMSVATKVLNPTINFQNGDVVRVPILMGTSVGQKFVINNVNQAIIICKRDWDNYETSWDFKHSPLINYGLSLNYSINQLNNHLSNQLVNLIDIETKLNKYFIDLYGLNDKLNPTVNKSRLSLANWNERKLITDFFSYFVGCLFGRYSLNQDGLIFAGGQWNDNVYKLFKPNSDNIVLLTDRDYFGDNRDIINRLKDFLTKAFDSDHLKDNLHFIANTLSPKKVERGIGDEQIIREYFLNDFYKDHDKMYHKRPIYWQFSSGRNDGFKALMYLHRYDRNELAMVRTYLHQLQEAYTNTIKLNEEQQKNADSAREKNQYRKDTAKLKKKIDEVIKYDEALQHQALAQVDIDLDDGVLVNHAKIQGNEKLLSKL